MTNNIQFRPCVPADADEAAPLIYSSGPLAFTYVFKTREINALDILKFAFKSKGGEFSFDNHYALVLNRKLVGIGSFFDKSRADGFMFRDIIKITKMYRLKSLMVMRRGWQIEQRIRAPKRNEISLAHIAVDISVRNKGLGGRMMKFLMREAKKRPEDTFVLDVSDVNPKAQSLYEKLGFKNQKHIVSNLKNEYAVVPDHFRMELR